MTLACLEHVNVTVKDPDQLAELFCELFEWNVRWSGPSKDSGYTVHVGSDERYFALYTHDNSIDTGLDHRNIGKVNHLGLVVNDLGSMEQRVLAKGFKPFSHSDHGVCQSFYFMADEALEVEIVYYKEAKK